jgi:hypothetical protein
MWTVKVKESADLVVFFFLMYKKEIVQQYVHPTISK